MKKILMALCAAGLLATARYLWLSPVVVETCTPSYESFSDGVFGTGGNYGLFALYAAGSVALGIAAVALGFWLAK